MILLRFADRAGCKSEGFFHATEEKHEKWPRPFHRACITSSGLLGAT